MNYLDNEENEIVESYERDEWISSDDNLKKTITEAAQKSQFKSKRINISDRKRD